MEAGERRGKGRGDELEEGGVGGDGEVGGGGGGEGRRCKGGE